MTKKHTEDNYKNLAKSLTLTWCGANLPQNSKTPTNWSCSNPEHPEFPATYNDLLKIKREHQSSGCIYCSGKLPTKTNNFAVLHPELARQWHPTKNKLIPTEVTPGSNQKVFWLCPVDLEHHRAATVVEVVQRGIPKCRQCNTLAAKRPDLIREWHPTKNGDLKPGDVSYGDDKPVWWQCQFDPEHEWRAPPNSRTSQDSGCPHCNKRASKLEIRVYTELLTLFPDTLWGEIIRGKECDVFIPSINIGIEVDGSYWHGDNIDKDVAKNAHFKTHGIDVLRLRENPLPKIADIDIQHKKNDRSLGLVKIIVQSLRKIRPQIDENTAVRYYLKRDKLAAIGDYRKRLAGLQFPPFEKSLEYLHPEIASTWDLEMNEPWTPNMFTPGSEQEVYWHCPVDGHPSFRYPIKMQRKQNGCQICTGRAVIYETSIASVLDKIKPFWHPTKNLPLTPDQMRLKEAQKKSWWLCGDCGYEWESTPYSICINKSGCDECTKLRVGAQRRQTAVEKSGSIKESLPKSLQFWDYERNTDISPEEVPAGSKLKVYFRCSKCGYAWPKKRYVKDLRRVLNTHKCIEPLSQRYPELNPYWDSDRNGDLHPDEIPSNSKDKFYWRCPTCSYRWEKPSVIAYFKKGGLDFHDCSATLSFAYPGVRQFWDDERNGDVTPDDVKQGSRQRIFLRCKSCGYQWGKSWPVSGVTRYGLVCSKCRASFVGRLLRRQGQAAGTNSE